MKSLIHLLVVVSAIAALGKSPALQASPQAIPKPDLSGKWTFVPTAETPRSDAPLFAGGSITQDATRLTVEAGNRTLTYRLDVPESRNETPTVRGEKWLLVSQVRWVTNALLITTRTNATNGNWEDILILSLAGPDKLNVVKVNTLMEGNGMATAVLSYKKSQ